MIIKKHEYNRDAQKPEKPEIGNWVKQWHGYYRLEECWDERLEAIARGGEVTEREFETDCFMSIMEDIIKDEVMIIEAGAGYGEWCMATAAIVKRRIIDVIPRKYHCVPVEADDKHYYWLTENLKRQGIEYTGYKQALSNQAGTACFNQFGFPRQQYGNSLTGSSKLISRIASRLLKKRVEVITNTIDRIVNAMHIENIVIHCDVQGAELAVVEGSMYSVDKNLIDYWLIGTHQLRGQPTNNAIMKKLQPYYDVVVNIYPGEVIKWAGIGRVHMGDGILLLRRKGLCWPS